MFSSLHSDWNIIGMMENIHKNIIYNQTNSIVHKNAEGKTHFFKVKSSIRRI